MAISLVASRILGGDFVGGESRSWWRFRRWRVEFLVVISLVASRVLGGDFVVGEAIVNLEVMSVYRHPLPEKKNGVGGVYTQANRGSGLTKYSYFHEHVLLSLDLVSLVLLTGGKCTNFSFL